MAPAASCYVNPINPFGKVFLDGFLARLVGAEETALWLGYESNGYPTPLPKDGSLVPFLTRSGRSAPDGKFYVWSLPEQAALRSACEKELERLRIPDVEVSLSSANGMRVPIGQPEIIFSM